MTNEIKTGYYKANTGHGVYYYGEEIDDTIDHVSSIQSFYSQLETLGDGEEIACFCDADDDEQLKEMRDIRDEYSIN